MMLNANVFISHVKTFYPEVLGLTNAQFDQSSSSSQSSRRTTPGGLRPTNKQSSGISQMKLLMPGSDLGSFMHLAQYKVPKLTNTIRRRPQANLFKLLQGYLAGYLAILTGHRPVVFINLQKDKLLQAEVDDQNRTVVWVDHHKTDRTFGNAFIALLPREVNWLKGLMEVSAHFGREQCLFVFQFDENQLSKLNMELKATWHHARMQGQISFGLIQTIANQAKKHLLAEERKCV
ncbi:hypothetical protein MHYP_G00329760 [Metynnis hypsauchen]